MRNLFQLAGVAMLALLSAFLALPSQAHAQVYGASTVTLSANLAYGQSQSFALPDGQVATVTCQSDFCPAGTVVSLGTAPALASVSYAPMYSYAAPTLPVYAGGGLTFPYSTGFYSTPFGFGGCQFACGFASGFPHFGHHGPNESGETEPVCLAGQHEHEHSEACS